MIRDAINDNQNIDANSYELKKLKEAVPQCFDKNGNFDMEKFQSLLKDKVNIKNEGYELKFLGKSYARMLASLDTTTVITPDEEHNAKDENKNSENIYITGDNLDGLKHLLKSYIRKIKCIYIDPPYNTGTDGFVYKDSFNFTVKDLTERLSIDEEEAQRILEMTQKGRASHSAWLTFMYPRLLLARDLLTDDGVIFISIDDNEQADLKLLCDEIFGEENFIAQLPRITKKGGKSSEIIAKNHDYLLIYAKTEKFLLYPLSHDDEGFKYTDEFFNERGYYKLNQTLDYDSLQYSKNLDYPLEIEGKIYYPGSSKEEYNNRQKGIHNVSDWIWRWSKAKFNFGYKNGFIVIKKSKNSSRIYTKTYQNAVINEKNGSYYIEYLSRTKSLSTLELIDNKYSNDRATKDIAQTIGKKIFDYTKPITFLELIFKLSTENFNIILDFFSGSSSTAEAVMKLNNNEGTKRKYIMVQLPEIIQDNKIAYNEGYRTIDEIGMERIIRAAKKIKEENPDTAADLGFKHYTLNEAGDSVLDTLFDFSMESNLISDNHILNMFGAPSVLATWLVYDGYGFGADAETVKFADYTAYRCQKHLYFINSGFDDEAMKALIEKYDGDGSFNPENIIVFGYSFEWTQMQMLKDNMHRLKITDRNIAVNIDIRY